MTIEEFIDVLKSTEFSSYEFRMNRDSIEYAMRLLTRKYRASLTNRFVAFCVEREVKQHTDSREDKNLKKGN